MPFNFPPHPPRPTPPNAVALAVGGLCVLGAGCDSEGTRAEKSAAAESCGESQIVDDAGACVPVACGTSIWGDYELGSGAVFVEAGASGDGTADNPFGSIGGALESGATKVQLAGQAGGTIYPEWLEFKHGDDVAIAGRCADLVTLNASGSDRGPGIYLKNDAVLSISGLTVTGGDAGGIQVMGASLDLTNVWVTANREWGLVVAESGGRLTMNGGAVSDTIAKPGGINLGLDLEFGGVAVLEGVEIARNPGIGVQVLGEGSSLTLRASSVIDTIPSDNPGTGLSVWDGATLEIEDGSLVDGNSGVGIGISSTTPDDPASLVSIRDSRIAGTLPSVAQGVAQAAGLQLNGNGEVELTRVAFDGNPAGVTAQGVDRQGNPYSTCSIATRQCTFAGMVVLPDLGSATLSEPSALSAAGGASVVDEESTITGGFAEGLSAHEGGDIQASRTLISGLTPLPGYRSVGAFGSDGGSLGLDGVVIRDFAGTGVHVQDGATLTALNLLVEDIGTPADSTAVGRGIQSSTASVTAVGTTIRRIEGQGFLQWEGDADLTDTSISGVTSGDSPYGGIAVLAEAWEGDGETHLSMKGGEILESDHVGILLIGPGVVGEVSDISIRGGAFAATVATHATPAGVEVIAGAVGTLANVVITDQPGTGILVAGASNDLQDLVFDDALLTATDVDISEVHADVYGPATAVTVQMQGNFQGTRVRVSNSVDIGLYAVHAELACSECSIDGFGRAAAVSNSGAHLELHGTRIGAGAEGTTGVYASGSLIPASILFDEGSSIAPGGLAGVYLDGAGSWQFRDCDIGGGFGAFIGTVLLNGNALFGYQTTAWDDSSQTGLLVENCTMTDSAGPGILLEEGTATLCDLAFARNVSDVAWQDCPTATAPEACQGGDLGEFAECPSEPHAFLPPGELEFDFVLPEVEPDPGI